MATEIELGYDLKDIPDEESNLENVPAGPYLLEVMRSKLMPEKDGRTSNVLITLQVVDAEKEELKRYAGDGKDVRPSNFLDNMYLGEKSGWRMKQFTKAIGTYVEGGKVDIDAWIGKRCKGQVIVETYDGKERNKVDRYAPASQFKGSTVVGGDDDVDI